jgi:hypothetical protein
MCGPSDVAKNQTPSVRWKINAQLETLDHLLAAWNEGDPGKVRAHLERALNPEVRFVDPSIDLTGIGAFEANIHEVKARIAGATYSRTSGVDSQHGFHRYHWTIHHNGELLLSGFDVTQTDERGLVLCVISFFSEVPEN